MPEEQVVQAVPPGGENPYTVVHAVQVDEPKADANVPGEHNEHVFELVAPTAVLYVPRAQDVQAEVPGVDAYRPAAQEVQAVTLSPLLKDPSGQEEQTALLTAVHAVTRIVPGAHVLQVRQAIWFVACENGVKAPTAA